MPELQPSPPPATLEKYVGMNRTLATDRPGRTRNELTCPGCPEILPREHGHMSHCPCGTSAAVFGNSLYHWPTGIGVPVPDPVEFPFRINRKTPPEADALYPSPGGSDIVLTPLTERAYQALLAADIGIAAGGADWTGEYPNVRLKAPTVTNTLYDRKVRPRYRKVSTALAGMKLTGEGPNLPYEIGDPETVWQ